MFWQKKEISIGGKVPLAIYHSKRSKIRVFVADTPGPMVEGHITFVTETDTNDGLPHTLEHLVFMGSHRYPYMGMLDTIANRCHAIGTNAYTDQDHTAYELRTAGSSGFLKVLPVFLDHLLRPKFTQQKYDTEVHHINGEGKDSGVVYSEMQALDLEMDSMLDKKRKELFYPAGSSYAAMTGGTLSDIRNMCTLERVRNFHKHFYHLSNMYITVCGKIDHKQLLDVIDPIETENRDAIPLNFATPFLASTPQLTEPRTARIVCPSDDESIGMVQMSWNGPPGFECKTTLALTILFDYLTDTLLKELVQIEQAHCTSVSFSMRLQRDCEIVCRFEGVPMTKLEEIRDHFFAACQLAGTIVMARIGFILDQKIQQFRSNLENRSPSLISAAVISHQLLGREDDPDYNVLEQCLNQADLLRQLKTERVEFWHALFHKWLANKNCVYVMAEPSKETAKEFRRKEADRIKAQIIRIGGEGLKKQKKRLDDAIAENTLKHPSNEELADLMVNTLEDFNVIPVFTSTNESQQSDDFVSKFPFTAVLHDVPSNFFDATIVFDTVGIPVEDRHFLLLLFQHMFHAPIGRDDGMVIHFQEAAERLSARELASHGVSIGIPSVYDRSIDFPRTCKKEEKLSRGLVSNTVDVGISGFYDRFVALRLRTGVDSVANLAKWADIYLKRVLFNPDSLASAAENAATIAAEHKRDGHTMCQFLEDWFTHASDSNTHFFSYLALEKFYTGVKEAMGSNRTDDVQNKLLAVRKLLLEAPMNVHFAGDPNKIQLGTGSSSTASPIADMATQWAFLKQAKKHPQLKCPADYGASEEQLGKSRAIVVGGADSAFLLQKTRFDDDWNGPSTMSTLLLAEYLQQTGGPLWKAVRDPGFAYGVFLNVMPDRKALSLDLYRCSQLTNAYQKTLETTLAVLNLDRLNTDLLDCAKRSLICKLISKEDTVEQAVTSAILATIRSVDNDFTRKLCSQIWYAKAEDVLATGGPPIRRLFDLKQSFRSIAVNPSREEELKEHFPETEVIRLDELQVPSF
ncbi:hypothetical protein niasHS_000299 [Heterodera schachtii]|uniref:Uncharacterized protein n=1 Tax=Heterodera schachtii TaxID=97005 RepID=A0ABD2KLD1_HETSC